MVRVPPSSFHRIDQDLYILESRHTKTEVMLGDRGVTDRLWRSEMGDLKAGSCPRVKVAAILRVLDRK